MIVVGLVVAGLVALALGLLGPSWGLVVVGLLWLPVAWAARRHALGLRATDVSAVRVSTVLQGAAILLVGGVPALVIGWSTWQIEDEGLRWLPLVVGSVLCAFAVVTAGGFLLGAGLAGVSGGPLTVPATLVIVSVTETGTMVNDRPRLEFVLDVTPDGQATYRVTKKATVPWTALGSIRPGDGFRAMVSGPDDPTAMDIDWSATRPQD